MRTADITALFTATLPQQFFPILSLQTVESRAAVSKIALVPVSTTDKKS
jgi:hypothetical protein